MEIFQNSQRLAGFLLLSSLIPFILIVMLAAKGQLPSIYGLFRPIEQLTDKLPLRGRDLPVQMAFGILLIAGFGVLTVHQQELGDKSLPLIAFVLFLAAMVLIAVEGAFYSSVNPWAAEETSRTGTTPAIFSALHHWMNTSIQMAYMLFGFLAFSGFGWSLLKTGIIPAWGAWATIIWSVAWLIFTIAAQVTLPAVLFIWPWVVGVLLIS